MRRAETEIRLPLHPWVLPAGLWWEKETLVVTADILDLGSLEAVQPVETASYGQMVLIQWVLGVAFFPMVENAACDALFETLHRLFTDTTPAGDLPAAQPPDYDAWREAWLRNAADRGDADAGYELGKLLIERGDPAGGEARLTVAADQNHAPAREFLIQRLTGQNRYAEAEELQAKWHPSR
jgi:hypothetical protein